ncbi:MAG: helix-turn-helix domain-containing protein [Candidatus Limnocylindrales bacterium]
MQTPTVQQVAPSPARRSTAARRRARSRAEYVARRIGTGFRDARLAQGLRQVDVALAAAISQPFYSRIERGLELGVSLLTLMACASALKVQLAAFVEALPGASLPRDIEHLRRQSLLVAIASRGGWLAAPEALLTNDGPRPRSIDVLLTRAERREAAVVEIWDLLLDGGDAMRVLDAKVLATQARLGPEWRVGGLLLLRRTSRNRTLVRGLAPLIVARFPASSGVWLRALATPGVPMPEGAGFAWTNVRGDRLVALRLPGSIP